jgi:hypothetical protein
MLALLRIYRPDLQIKVEETDDSVLIQVDGLAI